MKPHNNKSNVYSLTSKVFPQKSAVCSLQSAVCPPRRRQAAGFTLLELLIVIALIMVLAGLLIPAFFKAPNVAREKQHKIEATIIGTAIQAYKLQAKKLPAPPADLGGGSDRTYGTGNRDNRQVMDLLRDARPPVLDTNKLRWDRDGNVINPYGNQYKITLDLNYDGEVGGAKSDYKVE